EHLLFDRAPHRSKSTMRLCQQRLCHWHTKHKVVRNNEDEPGGNRLVKPFGYEQAVARELKLMVPMRPATGVFKIYWKALGFGHTHQQFFPFVAIELATENAVLDSLQSKIQTRLGNAVANSVVFDVVHDEGPQLLRYHLNLNA